MATTTDGLFVAGCAQGPKDIPDSVAQASAAAARMLATIAKGAVEIDPVRAEIDEQYCSGCRICNALCPYKAIDYLEEKNVSRVNIATVQRLWHLRGRLPGGRHHRQRLHRQAGLCGTGGRPERVDEG